MVRPLVNSAFVLTSWMVPSASSNSRTRLPGMSLNRSTPRAGIQAGPSVQVNPSATFSSWAPGMSRWSIVIVLPFARWDGYLRWSCRSRGVGQVLACHAHGLGDPCQRDEAQQTDACQDHVVPVEAEVRDPGRDRKSTRLNSSHVASSYAVFCLDANNK